VTIVLNLLWIISANILCLWHKYIRVITKLPNTEQSSKGKGKTHKHTNRQNQSTTGRLGKPQWPNEMVGWIRSYGVKPPASIRLKGSGCHYNSMYRFSIQALYDTVCQTLTNGRKFSLESPIPLHQSNWLMVADNCITHLQYNVMVLCIDNKSTVQTFILIYFTLILRGRRWRDRMVIGFTTTYASVSSTTEVVSSNSAHGEV
jgi:hypothetical protein